MPAQLSDLLTVGGLTVVVAIVVEVIKRAAAMTDAAIERFGPLMAVVVGVIVGGGVALYQAQDVAQAVLVGLLAGASAMGLSDLIGSAKVPSS